MRVSKAILAAGWMVAVATWVAPARGQQTEVDREYAFASWLVQNGFPDLAERLVDQLVRRFPDQADRGQVVLVESLIARRRFREAEEMVAKMPRGSPRAQAMRLAVARGYYRLGEYEKARALYESVFSEFGTAAPTDPDVRRFYMDAAYQLAQMHQMTGDWAGAGAALERVLQLKPDDEGLARRLMAELAEIWVRAAAQASGPARDEMLRKAKKLCENIQWKGLDLWFGRSVITLAHIELVQGNRDAAARLLRDYMDILRQLDEILKKEDISLAVSPMAGARFLLGEIYREQGETALSAGRSEEGTSLLVQALTEYVNVFARYPESDWALSAGEKADAVKARLEALGRTVRVDYGRHLQNMIQARFRLADNLFAQRRYREAAREYLKILNQFPAFEGVGRPLTNLIVSYAQEDDTLSMRATAEHIAERYARDAEAGLGLLAAAKVYFDRNAGEQYLYLYNLFVERFPRHERAPMVLFSLAGIARANGNEEAAERYLQRIIEQYPDDAHYLKALQQLAWQHYRAGRFEQAVEVFRQLVEKAPPSHERAVAQFSLGEALVRTGQFAEAIRAFDMLRQWLGKEGEDSAYGRTASELDKNREMLRLSLFYTGFALSRLEAPPERVRAVRETAIRKLQEFMEKAGDTNWGPKAMSLIGAVYLELGDSAQASAVFEELARRYPQSDEGRSAQYARISAAIELGRLDTAREAWAEVRRDPWRFGPDQLMRMAERMRGAGMLEEALEAYGFVRKDDRAERAHLERALFGFGTVAYDLKRYSEAAEAMEELLRRYPRTGLFYQARFLLGRIYRELDRLPESVEALSDVFRFADDPALINRANLELAEVQVRLARRHQREGRLAEYREQLQAAVASYQRVTISGGDPKDPVLRPLIEQAFAGSVPLLMELGRWDRAVEDCETYLGLYPDGARVTEFRRWREEARLRMAASGP